MTGVIYQPSAIQIQTFHKIFERDSGDSEEKNKNFFYILVIVLVLLAIPYIKRLTESPSSSIGFTQQPTNPSPLDESVP